MRTVNSRPSSLALSLLIFTLALPGYVCAAGPLLIAYDGHNETMARHRRHHHRDSGADVG